ncbi:hypothetical protein JXB28_01505 [Candidatus Woesearchaeota archaeon]|nr:hypothetical protein [Candidatus Woesearchaeota archaeon]
MRKRGGRRAQITMFVIMGIILLIIFLLLYLFLSGKINIRGGPRVASEAVPPEFKPVQNYVEGCIHMIGLNAIKKMGAHGGYIEPLDREITPINLRFNSIRPTSYELASLTGDYSSAVPYYLHVPRDSSYFNYGIESLAPTIESMEFQLSLYVSRELPGCVREFEELEAQGFDISSDNENIITTVYIRDDKIEFIVKYNIDASKGGVKTKISGFTDDIRFPFKKYYELATVITAVEALTQFIEGFTTNLISYYSGLNPNLLPPFTEYTNAPYVMTWSNAKARNDLDSLLQSYLSALQIMNTSGYEPITLDAEEEIERNFYNSLSIEIFNETISESISFYYVPYTLKMRVQPSKGDMIRPSIEVKKSNQFLPASEFNTYKFFYDVSYPVIVEIRGNEPMTEIQDYSFFFALEANIIENKPVMAWVMGMGTVDWDYSYLNATYTLPEDAIDSELAEDDPGQIIYRPRSSAKSMFCQEETWNSGEISINLVDALGLSPLEGVDISFGCGDYDECWIGSTGADGGWIGKLPICRGGYLSLTKEGYGSKNLMLSTEQGISASLPQTGLYKMKEVNATIKKFEIQKVFTRTGDNNWVWEAGPDSLGAMEDIDAETEQAIVTISQIGFEAGSNQISSTLIFGVDGMENPSLQLVPGEYEVSVNFLDYEGILIPGNCSRICQGAHVLGICVGGYEYFPSPDTEINPAPWGGLEISEEATGSFVITSGDLESATDIEFRFFTLPDVKKSIPSGGCLENLQEVEKIAEYSSKYLSELTPRLR